MHDDAPSEKPDPSLCGATGTRVPIIAPIAPKRVVFVLYDGFQPLDLAGSPGVQLRQRGKAALYQLGTVAAEPVVATWDQGLRMQVDCTFGRRGWSGGHDRGARRPGVERASAHGERARLAAPARRRAALAASAPAPSCWLAPLLDGRVVTTHWRSADRLRQLYPALRVEDDRLYVDSGKYWTSAGVSAGIDLALALIERDHGPELSQRRAGWWSS